jgi:Zonular occludens toxin (Zot)
MIYLIIGKPGEGKGVFAAWLARRSLKQNKRVYADYFLAGARPWLSWEDCATPAFRGAVFFGDEVGSTFNSRQTLHLDPIVFAAATMHRKVGVDLYLTAQHLSFVDIQFRRLCHGVYVVKRHGPDGGAVLAGARPRLWNRPWFFTARRYDMDQFDDSTDELRPGQLDQQKEFRRVWWSRSLVASYDSSQLIIPASLIERWEVLCSTAEERARLPVMRPGRRVDEERYAGVALPERIDGKRAASAAANVGTVDVVNSRGFYSDGKVYGL